MQNKLVKLPVGIGEVVYLKHKGKVHELKIGGLNIQANGCKILFGYPTDNTDKTVYGLGLDDFEKKYFYERECAKKSEEIKD